MMLKRKRDGHDAERPQRLVPLSTVLIAVVLSAVLASAATAVLHELVLDEPGGPPGPAGPSGPAGRPGPAGPSGDAGELDAEEVWEQIESDPDRLAEVLDPTPTELRDRDDELATEIEQVRTDLGSLCTDLSFADALSDEVLSCP